MTANSNSIFPKTLSTQSTGHMTFENAREEDAGNSIIGISRNPSMFTHGIGEAYMDPHQIFKSPVRLASYQWTTGDAVGTQFLRYRLPEAFLLNNTFHELLLRTYVFYKPNIKITIQVNATPQHMGLLRLWYDPFNQYKAVPSPAPVYSGRPAQKNPNVWTTSGQPHADLQACDSSPVDLPIPYEHPQICLTTNSIDPITNMGTFGVMIINALECPPTSTSSVTVQMWMSFDDVELAVPIWNHTPTIPAIQQSGGDVVITMDPTDTDIPSENGAFVDAQDPGGSYGPPAQSKPDRAWWEKGLSLLGGIGGTIWNGITGNWGGAVRSGIDAAKSLGDLLMDKPSDPLRAVNNMVFPLPPLAHTQGVGGHVRLDAAPMGGYTNIDFSSRDPMEMKMKEIMSVPMMALRFDWSDSQAPGITLRRFPVTPSLCNYDIVSGPFENDDGSPNPTPGSYIQRTPTYLSKVSSLFRFWSGSIKYHFQFITTSLHTGKVMVTFIPNNYSSPETQTLQQQSCAQSAVFDVAGQKNFDFSPKWVSAEPRKSWYDWSTVDYSLLDDRTIYGWIEIKVVGQLTVTNAIPNTVHCNVYISAGDDFFCEELFHNPFSFPVGYPVRTTYVPPPPGPIPAIQQSDDNPKYLANDASQPLNNMRSTKPSQMTNQAIGDIRDACRRANYLGIFRIPMTQTLTGTTAGTGMWRGVLQFRTDPVTTDAASNIQAQAPLGVTVGLDVGKPNPQQNLMSYISDMFVFWSGGIDFTFIPYTGGSTGVHLKAYNYPVYIDDIDRLAVVKDGFGLFGSLAAHKTILGQQRALQVTSPFTTNYNQCALLSDVAAEYQEEVYTSGVVTLEATCSTNEGFVEIEGGTHPYLLVEVYKTLGDDGRFSWLVAPGEEWTFRSASPP